MEEQAVYIRFEGEYIQGTLVPNQGSCEKGEGDDGFQLVGVTQLGVTIPIPKEDIFPSNGPVEERFQELKDLTSLQHLHEPSILKVLEGRAYQNLPYTFLSGILISINPLIEIEEQVGPGFQAQPGQILEPHPYSIAETAFQQLCFAVKNSQPCAQSIVIAGESGAGKTEVSKRVIRHLIERTQTVRRCEAPAQQLEQVSIDKQLLEINPILESFGNAATLRNHNSSRFGKFTKLHFDCSNRDKIRLVCASISSYLLERSRISFHSQGERTFRVFYELLNGAKEELRSTLCLDDGDMDKYPGFGFRYLTPVLSEGELATQDLNPDDQCNADEANFNKLLHSFRTTGLSQMEHQILSTLAGILHLGNICFEERESEQGSVAGLRDEGKGEASAHVLASKLLGLEQAELTDLLLERNVKLPGGEVVKVHRKLHESVESRDALAKSLYSSLFDWLLKKINSKFAPEHVDASTFDSTYVGVLDIFGFETFVKNDFEQLLINFANEALQQVFHETVLVAEAALYREEGLVADKATRAASEPQGQEQHPSDDLSCLVLLVGNRASGYKGILQVLEAESECPNPTDEKFINLLHSKYTSHPKFPTPHPKDKRSTFIVSHYASDVTYTVGNFMRKNLDRIPKEAQVVLSKSQDDFIQQLLLSTSEEGSPGAHGKRQNHNKSIVSKFSKQISALVKDLKSTQCSFVRCIKPNLAMTRDFEEGNWFHASYVLDQLRYLGIPQTAKALRGGGFPTRIDYKDVLVNFQDRIPVDVFNTCKTLLDIGGGSVSDELQRRRNARFIRALFLAYQVPPDCYRCGRNKIFFTAGALEQVDTVLEQVGSTAPPQVLADFRKYCVRSAWRTCATKALAGKRFVDLLEGIREKAAAREKAQKHDAATKIQACFRRTLARASYQDAIYAVWTIQAVWRMALERKAFRRQMDCIRREQHKKQMQQEVKEHLQAQIKLCQEQMALLRQQCMQPMRLGMEQAASMIKNHSPMARDAARPPVPPPVSTKDTDPPHSGIESPSSSSSSSSDSSDAGTAQETQRAPPPLPPKPSHKRGSIILQQGIDEEEEKREESQVETKDEAQEIDNSDLSSPQEPPPPPPPPRELRRKKPSTRPATCHEQNAEKKEENELEDRDPPQVARRPVSARMPLSQLHHQEQAANIRPPSLPAKKTRPISSGDASKKPAPPPKSARTIQRQSIRIHSGKQMLPIAPPPLRFTRRASWRENSEEEHKRQRTVFLRLRQDEKSYVDALSIISGNYFQPLMMRLSLDDQVSGASGMSKILKKREIDIIFSNLTQILHLHAQILGTLETQLARQKKNPHHDMTLGFITSFRTTLPFMKTIYAVYVKQHSSSMSELSRCRTDLQKFSRFLRATAENKNLPSYGTDLKDLLKIPLGQISRYNEFLHTLLSCTNPESEAHSHLREACKTVEVISKELDEERKVARRDIRAYEIAQQLEGINKSGWKRARFASNVHHSMLEATNPTHQGQMNVNTHLSISSLKDHSDAGLLKSSLDEQQQQQQHILCPGRSFLQEWIVPLSVSNRDPNTGEQGPESKPKQRVFFLFSDLLIVAKKTAPHKYEMKMWIDLSKVWVDASHMGKPSGNGANSPSSAGRESSGKSVRSSLGSAFSDATLASREAVLASRIDRIYPLQLVYVNTVADRSETLSSHTSVALRLLQRRKAKGSDVQSHVTTKTKVENLVMLFDSPTDRKEVYSALTTASKELKRRREQLARMQKELGGKGISSSNMQVAA